MCTGGASAVYGRGYRNQQLNYLRLSRNYENNEPRLCEGREAIQWPKCLDCFTTFAKTGLFHNRGASLNIFLHTYAVFLLNETPPAAEVIFKLICYIYLLNSAPTRSIAVFNMLLGQPRLTRKNPAPASPKDTPLENHTLAWFNLSSNC